MVVGETHHLGKHPYVYTIDHTHRPPGVAAWNHYLRFPVGGWRLAPRSHCQKTSCQGEALFVSRPIPPIFSGDLLDEKKTMIRVLKLSNFQLLKEFGSLAVCKELQQKYGDIWQNPPNPSMHPLKLRIDKGC